VKTEAQHLDLAGMNMLRYFHDHPDAQWTLVLVGAGIGKKIKNNRELVSRITRRVHFGPLVGEELVTALRAYQPALYVAASPDLLHEVDVLLDQADLGRGNLRSWAGFTGAALQVQQSLVGAASGGARGPAQATTATLTQHVASRALALLGGTS